MAAITVAEFVFTVATNGNVVVTGPGIIGGGLPLGPLDSLSPAVIQDAANRPRAGTATQALITISPRAYEIRASLQDQVKQELAGQSTGVTVAEQQRANANGADTQNPNRGPQVVTATGRVTPAVTTAATNAQRYSANVEDIGVDDPVRKQSQLMSTPGIVAQPGPAAPSTGGPFPAQTPGAAARTEDNTPPATGVRAGVEAIFGSGTPAGKIIPQPNILDNYASYTYSISLYLMNAQDFQNMLRTRNKSISGYQLLMQSAGAAQGVAGVIDPNVAADDFAAAALEAEKKRGRNQFFPLDYYFDDLELVSVVQGKGTGLAHNVAKLKFKIIEPNGISLLDNLFRATQQYCNLTRTAASQNYAAQNYLMVIRWYGYDVNGNLVKPGRTGQDAPGSDANAIVEKFIPFQFSSIKFRVANKLTEYQCEAVCPQYLVGTSRSRGTIPYNVEISSQTLRELFTGNLNFATTAQVSGAATGRGTGQQADLRRSDNAIAANARFEEELDNSAILSGVGATSTSTVDGSPAGTVVAGKSPTQSTAPKKADAAANPTLTAGLSAALNKFQQDLVDKGVIGVADDYSIVITDDIIASAKVTPPGGLNKQAIAFNSKKNATAADQKLPSKSTPNTNSKSSNAFAGMSVMQFLDQCIRTSTYIYDQQTKVVDPNNPNAPPKQQGAQTGVTAWYHIDVEARPKEYDSVRNDYAYSITYRISPYKINDLQSDWFPTAKFQGTHKQYNYWFTGLNTSILNLEQDFNYLYYLVVNTGAQVNNTGQTTNYREYIKRAYQPNSNQSSQGITNSNVNEPSANAADYLYSPSDQAKIAMQIVGDPAWIQQGELWEGVNGLQMNYEPFLPDGTINFSAQEVLFEVLFNKPVDYDLNTGLMDPGQKNYGANRQDGRPGDATQSYIYKATTVTSRFSKGRFTQDLDGVIILFPLTKQTDRQIENAPQAVAPAVATRTPVLGQQADIRRADNAIIPAPFPTLDRLRPYLQDQTNSNIAEFGEPTDPDAALIQGAGQNPPALPLNTRAPTSSTQVIGPASNSAATNSQGGASGFTGMGVPSVQIPLTSGQVTTVTTQPQIQALLDQGSISATQFQTYSQQLAVKQTAANSPTTSLLLQRGLKEF